MKRKMFLMVLVVAAIFIAVGAVKGLLLGKKSAPEPAALHLSPLAGEEKAVRIPPSQPAPTPVPKTFVKEGADRESASRKGSVLPEEFSKY